MCDITIFVLHCRTKVVDGQTECYKNTIKFPKLLHISSNRFMLTNVYYTMKTKSFVFHQGRQISLLQFHLAAAYQWNRVLGYRTIVHCFCSRCGYWQWKISQLYHGTLTFNINNFLAMCLKKSYPNRCRDACKLEYWRLQFMYHKN